jgi:hypothetical protein
MARFNPNTFNPIYPESNDKKGEIQLIVIKEPNEVDEIFTEVMRLDFLPAIKNCTLQYTGVGRQTMYRSVKYTNYDLPWCADDLATDSFLSGIIPQTQDWISVIRNNTTAYQNYLNAIITDEGFSENLEITHVHVIDSNIQYFERAAEHIFFQTYDVIFYGQQSPNPFIAPAPPEPECEAIPDYEFRVAYDIADPTKGNAFIDGGLTNLAQVELFPKGGGTGINFSTACVFGYTVGNEPAIPVGDYYTIRLQANPLLAGTTLTVSIQPLNQPEQFVTLTDSPLGTDVYLLFQMASGAKTIRVETAPQSPTAGENEPLFTLSLYTAECFVNT